MEYDEKGILTFKGEYLRGERNGKGEEYHRSFMFGGGDLKFEGEYLKENIILMKDWNMKVNLCFIINLMEKGMIKMVI